MKHALAAILLLIGSKIFSQEIGLNASNSWTDNEAIGTLPGFGISLYQSLGVFGLRLDYSRSGKSEYYEGILVRGTMVPPSITDTETIESETEVESYELFMAFNDLLQYKSFAFNAALGGSVDNFSVSNFGSSSRLTDGMSETKYGWQYLLSISYNKLLNLPIKPYVAFKHKFMYGTKYVTDVENMFEGNIQSVQLQVGIYYIFNK
jgi:hypothetical protein